MGVIMFQIIAMQITNRIPNYCVNISQQMVNYSKLNGDANMPVQIANQASLNNVNNVNNAMANQIPVNSVFRPRISTIINYREAVYQTI
ncbi:hypothetical protein Glove_91g48 [Diversispora epigaea]|uniref:Uncharacterized protein n=1 Tax=Diversispora epigaea TaxID=1348612 RepID=A0A397JG20_9GLOM|nr:hypothetical protein Glove_91g48 [Diversispora epigaea]